MMKTSKTSIKGLVIIEPKLSISNIMNIIKIEQNWGDYTKILLIDEESKSTVYVFNYSNESWISGLYVPEEFRKKGIASKLLDICDTLTIHSPIDIGTEYNAPEWLKNFYKNRGYRITEEVE